MSFLVEKPRCLVNDKTSLQMYKNYIIQLSANNQTDDIQTYYLNLLMINDICKDITYIQENKDIKSKSEATSNNR